MIKHYAPKFSFLLFLLSISAFSQFTIQGKLMDQHQEPVAFANVILLNATDSTQIYKGTISNETGNFSFDDIAVNSYLLKISFVGFENLLKRISVEGNDKFGNFILKEVTDQLDGVTIKVKTPSVTRQVDRLVFHVENSSLSSGNSWQILRKTPGVILANETLQVRNQPVVVYINDRKVQLSASELKMLLENYSAENIKQVEVITNPPAKYDAEGGAVLNIVTSKSISLGYKGSVNANWTQAIFPKYSLGTSQYFKTEKWNLFANYSFNPKKIYKKDLSHINFIRDNAIFSRWETDFERTTHSKAHNANIVLDFSLNEKDTWSFSANIVVSPNKKSDNSGRTNIIQGLYGSDFFETFSDLDEDQSNIATELQYKRQLENPDASISVKAQYTRYDQDKSQEISTIYSGIGNFGNDNSFQTLAKQHINIYVGQLDYVTPLGSGNFETGLKASVINSESGIDYIMLEGPEVDDIMTDNFLYDEEISAGYASFAKDWEKWSLKAGLRGEYTHRKGDSRAMDQVDDRNYFDLFPTFYIQHHVSDAHSFTVDYSRRIQRPRYERLNPFRYFINEHNYTTGNPNLRAAISDNFNLNYTLKGSYFFDLYYRDNGPSSQVLSFQDNESLDLRSASVNLLGSKSYGFDISHYRALTSFWTVSAYASFFHDEQSFTALESNNTKVINAINGFYGSLYNSFTLSKNGTFTGDLALVYVSDWITGSYTFDPMTTLSIGVRKTLWNNRAELSLHLEDILDKTNTRLSSTYLNQDNSFFAQPESRYVRLGFKYKFGNFRLSDNQRDIEAAERERL